MASVIVTVTSPPGIRTRSVPSRPRWQRGDRGGDGSRSAGTGFADAALVHPHRHGAVHRRGEHLHVDAARGTARASNQTGAATSSAARSAPVSAASTQARCGLPTSMARPANRRPPTTAEPVPKLVGLAHVDGDVGRQSHRRRCRTTGRGPASEPTTNSSRSPGRWPAGSGRTPARRCRTSARWSRRRCGSPCTSRRARRRRACRSNTPAASAASAVVTRSTPSAPSPRRRSHSAATACGRQRQAGVRGRAAARSRSPCRAPWRTSPDQDTCHPPAARILLAVPPASTPCRRCPARPSSQGCGGRGGTTTAACARSAGCR